MKIKSRRIIALHMLLLCVIYFTMPADAAKYDYSKRTLPNGMTMIYRELPKTKTVCFRIVVPVGHLHETPQLKGIAHLTEHLVFRGNNDYRSERINSLVKDIGGSCNGFTFLNRTEYIIEVPKENFEPAARMLFNIVLFPTFEEIDILREKGIIMVEERINNKPCFCFSQLSQWDNLEANARINSNNKFRGY